MSGRASNYYAYLSQKTFTSGQVVEIFLAIIIGGSLIYGGLQLQDDQNIIHKHAVDYENAFNNTLGWIYIGVGALVVVVGLMRLLKGGSS